MHLKNETSNRKIESIQTKIPEHWNTMEQLIPERVPAPRFNDPEKPLVTVLIFNYNYGRYLRQCFDSVLAQTYDNIEISFSDNASEDDSWEVALEYARKYPDKVTVTRNRMNFGSDANFANCWANCRGKYFIELCSDDALLPEFVEKCVLALEAHPTAGFAMVHRGIINEHEEYVDEPPFYNETCLIPGPEQAAVYMMGAVNPSVSQIMYNKKLTYEKTATGGIAGRWYGTRLLDFNMVCDYPMVYIKEPLMLHRLHLQNDSFNAADNLMEVIGPFVLQHQFAETASIFGHKKAADRLPKSLMKLSMLCLRYCVRALIKRDDYGATRYFHLAAAIVPDCMEEEIFKKIEGYWTADEEGKAQIVADLESTDNLKTRTVSYDPPDGFVRLDL